MILQLAVLIAVVGVWLATLRIHARPAELLESHWRNFRGSNTEIVESDDAGPVTWWVDPVGGRFDNALLVALFGLPSVGLTAAAVVLAGGDDPAIAIVPCGLAAGFGWLAAGMVADFFQPHPFRRGRRVQVTDDGVTVTTVDGFAAHQAALDASPLEVREIRTRTRNPDDEVHYAPGKAPSIEELRFELRAGDVLIAASRARDPVDRIGERVASTLQLPIRTTQVKRRA